MKIIYGTNEGSQKSDYFKGTSNNYFASKFSEFFIDNDFFLHYRDNAKKLNNFNCIRHSSSQWLGYALICTKFEAVYEKL